MAIFRPIDWDPNLGIGQFNTAHPDNMKQSGTAMFYGHSFEAAGWLAVFRNTEKTTVKIDKVYSIVGTRATKENLNPELSIKIMCKPLGTKYTEDSSSIEIDPAYTTSVSNPIHVKDKLSTEEFVCVQLQNPIEVKSMEYFCVGFLGTDIPVNHYFNMASRKLNYVVNNIFYTQDSNTDKLVTWYRSGNANDNTGWKKFYAYIWAEGQLEESAQLNPSITNESPELGSAREQLITLALTAQNTVIPQGSETKITVDAIITPNMYPTTSLKSPKLILATESNDKFKISLDDNIVTVKSAGYSKTDLTTTVTIIAESSNNPDYRVSKSIQITATAPTIDSLTVSKSVLRPTETAKISCKASANAGTISYILSGNYAELKGNTITASNRTDNFSNNSITLTASTDAKHGSISKSISIPLKHWDASDLQVALSSNALFDKCIYGSERDKLTVVNVSNNDLKVNLALSSLLSFSSTKSVTSESGLETSAGKTIYINPKKTFSKGTQKLTVSLACDTTVSKEYTITLSTLAPTKTSEAQIMYPSGLKTGTSINLPAVATKSGSKYKAHLSAYPIMLYIPNATNENDMYSVRVLLKAKYNGTTSTLKLGNAFDRTILKGFCWLRPKVSQIECSSKNPSVEYTLTIEQVTGIDKFKTLLTKTFTINYTLYTDTTDLISAGDQNATFRDTFTKADNTLKLARDILAQYKPASISTLSSDKYINNYKQDLVSALKGLQELIKGINDYAYSLILMEDSHRTQLAIGQYIMADDSVDKLSEGDIVNSFKNSTDYTTKTASPFKEIVKAVQNLTGSVEHYNITYEDKNIINVKNSSGTNLNSEKINLLYL